MNIIVNTTKEPIKTPRTLNGIQSVSIEKTQGIEDMEFREHEHERLKRLERLRFFKIEDKLSKSGEWQGADIRLFVVGIQNVLLELGFQRFDFNEEKSVMIRLVDNIVEEVSQKRIIDAFIKYVNDEYGTSLETPCGEFIPINMLLEKIFRSLNLLFSETMMFRLKTDEKFEFNKDTATESFFYYKNGYVKVNKDGFDLLEYKTLSKKIWRSQMLNRAFKIVKKNLADGSNPGLFFNYVAGNFIKDGKEQNPTRAEDLRRIIGYLMHRYYEGKLKCVVLTDSSLSDDDSGRSGKTLLVQMIGWMLSDNVESKSYVELDGKEFDIMSNFKWQLLGINTELVHLNDIKKGFNIEYLYNSILTGITVQQKNQIPFIRLVKLVLSTNKTIKINGPSAQDRTLEFQLSKYFHQDHSPLDEFKQWFGKDWDAETWAKFDNFMVQSICNYLKRGLPKVKNFNIGLRKFKEETHADFVEFIDDVIEDYIKKKARIWKKEFLAHFKTVYSDHDKLTSQKFSLWLKAIKLHTDFDFDERRDKQKYDNELIFKLKETIYLLAISCKDKDLRKVEIKANDMPSAIELAKKEIKAGETYQLSVKKEI